MAQPQPLTQPKDKRTKNFQEVSFGFTKKVTLEEARRCPQCAEATCLPACPLGIDIPAFIRLLREGDANAALSKIKEQNPFPSICGRICLAPCERSCVFEKEDAPIGIRAMERYAADHGRVKPLAKPKSASGVSKVAIIGSGPAGLTAAAELVKFGYQVKIFESLPLAGGILCYGVPEFRLPAKVLEAEIEGLKASGVEIETNCRLGHAITVDLLFAQGFVAVLLALGTSRPKFATIPGNSLGGVFYSEEVLIYSNLLKFGLFTKPMLPMNFGNNVLVIGDSHAALDCARVCVRWGKAVTLAFESTEEEMFVYERERDLAKEEGIKLQALTKVAELIPDERNFVNGAKCMHMDFADPSSSNNWQLMAVPGSEFSLQADTIVIAANKKATPMVKRLAQDLKVNADGTIWTNSESGLTSRPKIFAAGDVAGSAGNLVSAMASGKKAAKNIDRFLKKVK